MKAWARQQAALSGETARFFLDLDLTMAQFRALAVIRRSGKLTGRDLAGRLQVTLGRWDRCAIASRSTATCDESRIQMTAV